MSLKYLRLFLIPAVLGLSGPAVAAEWAAPYAPAPGGLRSGDEAATAPHAGAREREACREFSLSLTVGGKAREVVGRACRGNGRGWQIVAERHRAGGYCREYVTTLRVGEKSVQAHGTACRGAGGAWRLVEPAGRVARGAACRPFRVMAVIAGERRGLRGTVCQTDSGAWRIAGAPGRDHDRARDAVAAGHALPLREVLARVRPHYPGRLLDADLRRGGSRGAWMYQLKLLAPGGHVQYLRVDARSGRVLQVAGGGPSGRRR